MCLSVSSLLIRTLVPGFRAHPLQNELISIFNYTCKDLTSKESPHSEVSGGRESGGSLFNPLQKDRMEVEGDKVTATG